jgi:hypothetical protein
MRAWTASADLGIVRMNQTTRKSQGGIDFYRGAHSIHLVNVGEIWPLSLVAFLRADSNSCAVFAAATIEFIGVFNV